jgi:hypothetical protein
VAGRPAYILRMRTRPGGALFTTPPGACSRDRRSWPGPELTALYRSAERTLTDRIVALRLLRPPSAGGRADALRAFFDGIATIRLCIDQVVRRFSATLPDPFGATTLSRPLTAHPSFSLKTTQSGLCADPLVRRGQPGRLQSAGRRRLTLSWARSSSSWTRRTPRSPPARHRVPILPHAGARAPRPCAQRADRAAGRHDAVP